MMASAYAARSEREERLRNLLPEPLRSLKYVEHHAREAESTEEYFSAQIAGNAKFGVTEAADSSDRMHKRAEKRGSSAT